MSFQDNRRQLMAVVLVLTAGSLIYRLLYWGGLEQTSALFIGLPALLCIILLGSARPKSAMGLALTATTLVLLMSGIVLGEGFICILIASPLFYLITIAVVVFDEWVKRKKEKLRAVVLLPFAVLALEGALPGFEFSRDETVTIEVALPLPAADFERSLARPPALREPLPPTLRPGFPRPVGAAGAGLEPGDRRRIDFRGGGRISPVEFEILARSPGQVTMGLVRDETPISHWLSWRRTRIEWNESGSGTRVRLTLEYRRELDPAWYFGPLERRVVRVAGRYLAESLAGGPVARPTTGEP